MQADSTICLSLIVKNESQVIARCLRSVLPVIDYWVICDTGSTDNTRELIRELLKDMPGELLEHPWQNFAYNRNKALAHCKGKADYILLLDADMVLNIQPGFNKQLNEDAYLLQYTGDLDYCQTMLVNNRFDWKYVGVTHEYIHAEGAKSAKRINTLSLTHYADGGSRSDKFKRDKMLLKNALKTEPGNARYHFYLAQSYKDLGEYENAISSYQKRIDLGGWDEETWYAVHQFALMKHKAGHKWEEVLQAHLNAYQFRPTRSEPLYHIIKYYREKEQYQTAFLFARAAMDIAYPDDVLFIDKPVYDYLIPFEYAICCFYLGDHDEAIDINNWLVGDKDVPVSIAAQALTNLRHSLAIKYGRTPDLEGLKIWVFSFDMKIVGGSGISIKLLGNALEQLGAAVWFTNSLPDEKTAGPMPDIFITHQFATAPAINFTQLHNIPLVMYVHGPEQYEQFFNDKNSPALTLFCSAHQQYLVKAKYPDINSTVLYPIIDDSLENGVVKDQKYITMVGSGILKGQEVFLKIAASLPGEQFLLVGDVDPQLQPELSNLTTRPVQPGLTGVFESTKLLLAPTQVESYGRVIVEAGCYGIPAIITNLPGPKEAASFTKATIIYNRDDIAEWRTAIRTVSDNYDHYSTMARQLVEARKQQAAINAVAEKICLIVQKSLD